MATDNLVLNAGSGGSTVRTLADASANEWSAAVVSYATTVSPGANVLQVVTPTAGLPVAQQGTWTVTGTGGTFPVTGTFWQATQPVSIAATIATTQSGTWTNTVTQATAGNLNATVVGTGTFAVQAAQSGTWTVTGAGGTFPVTGTVTANAGTNLNTSTLALESGGNIASLNTKTPALGQALAAASVPVVLTAAQLLTLTPLTTITTVTTVSALTSITNALPAGTNLLGSVAVGQQVNAMFNGIAAVTPTCLQFSASSPGTTTIIALSAGKKIYVLRWRVCASAAATVNLQSHTTTTLATGTQYLPAFGSGGGAYCPAGIMITASGEALDLVFSGTGPISGELTYVQF